MTSNTTTTPATWEGSSKVPITKPYSQGAWQYETKWEPIQAAKWSHRIIFGRVQDECFDEFDDELFDEFDDELFDEFVDEFLGKFIDEFVENLGWLLMFCQYFGDSTKMMTFGWRTPNPGFNPTRRK